MAMNQASRSLKLYTPLGDNELLLTAFHGQEELSRLFRFDLEMISDNNAITAKEIVGKKITFSIDRADGDPRLFNGFVSRFVAGDEDVEGRRNYRAQVVPWLWFLTRTSDCRIFQKKKVPEIIEQIFGDLGFSDFDTSKIKGAHPQWEYCVQYRETDFNFVSRLMEQEGIFYFFKHEQGRHTLVLADQKTAYEKCGESRADFPRDFSPSAIADHITSWEHAYEFRTGKWAHTDYNFETPSNNLMTTEQTVMQLPGVDKYEYYDYPGEYGTTGDGTPLAKVHMEEEEVEHDVVQGSSTCKTFCPGYKFTIGQHRSSAEEGKGFVITSVRYSASEPLSYETGRGPSGPAYRNTFSCVPDSVAFRPARITPKPVVQGCQTAVVTGPAGEEIYPDKYGRVKVQFHWDRKGKKDENTSCWIRCMQSSAGKMWGTVFIPRIGQEVVVDFLEGDPDRPLVVGLVYNAEQMPHYSLPAEKTKSYFKTNSSPGGDGYNEIRFEDKAGQEQIFIHAQRNVDQRVLNDSMEHVIHDRHLIVGSDQDGKTGDQNEMVFQDKNLNIKRNQAEHIEGNMQLMIGNGEADESGKLDVVVEKKMTEWIGEDGYDFHLKGNRRVLVDKSDSLSIGGDQMEAIGGARHLQVKGNYNQKIDGSNSLDVGMSHEQKVGLKHAVDAGQEVHLKAGMKVIIEAGVQVSLVGPGGFVDIGPAGVTIQGIMVKINSGGSAGSGSGASPEAPKDPVKPVDAQHAAPIQPLEADDSTTGRKSAPD